MTLALTSAARELDCARSCSAEKRDVFSVKQQ